MLLATTFNKLSEIHGRPQAQQFDFRGNTYNFRENAAEWLRSKKRMPCRFQFILMPGAGRYKLRDEFGWDNGRLRSENTCPLGQLIACGRAFMMAAWRNWSKPETGAASGFSI